MKQALVDQWVAALRSGQYKQGRFALRDADNNYCCLGVLCDLVNKEGWYQALDNSPYFFNNKQDVLPKKLRAELGISADWQDKLAEMNDHEDTNFDEIASYIETNHERFEG